MTIANARSLAAGRVTIDELRTLTKPFTIAKHYVGDALKTYAYDTLVVDGDLVIDGDFDMFAHKLCCMVVTGSLRVGGFYRDHDDPQTAVFVLGDFEATRAITAGALAVAGDVRAREVLVGFYNDHSAELHGDVTTTVFAPENHFFTIGGKLNAKHVIGRGAEWRVPAKLKKAAMPVDDAVLPTLVVPEVLQIEDYGDPDETPEINLDHELLRKRAASKLAILLDPAAAAVATSQAAKMTAKSSTTKTANASTKKTAKPAVKKTAASAVKKTATSSTKKTATSSTKKTATSSTKRTAKSSRKKTAKSSTKRTATSSTKKRRA